MRGGTLDQEAVLKQFEHLEKKIERLIEACEQREAENLELKREKNLLISQLQEKEVNEKQANELKALVRSKIDSLVGRLSQFAEE
jgi:predicted type IV restriction endonuclease